jgi:hypothetical protein
MSYIRREESLEALAARSIREGKQFGEHFARFGPNLEGFHRRTLPHTLSRLACGEPLDERDDDCVAAMGEALVCQANKLCPGYGNRVLNVCTHDDFLITQELEDLRCFILRWQSFDFVRGQVRALIAARRLLRSAGDIC